MCAGGINSLRLLARSLYCGFTCVLHCMKLCIIGVSKNFMSFVRSVIVVSLEKHLIFDKDFI